MGFLFGFAFAVLLRTVLLFSRLFVTSSLQGIVLRKKKKITQLLPEAYTSRERPAPNHHTLPGNGGSEDRMSPCSSLLGFGLAKQRQEGHVFTVGLRRSLPIWISAPSTCLP